MDKKILIIGAGPCGLGAAYRLNELGHTDWKIYEKNDFVGGLSASFADENGFHWDTGGHVLFSFHDYFDRFVSTALSGRFLEHQRRAYIRLFDRWVAYPFQNNFHALPVDKTIQCLWGLMVAKILKKDPENFREWIILNFGKGIAQYFMLPYNSKIWSYALEKMSFEWTSERVNTVSLRKAARNLIFLKEDSCWGQNNRFRFPLHGGTGEIFRNIATIFKDRLFLEKEVEGIDLEKKTVLLSDGSRDNYDVLINTMPLDVLVERSASSQFYGEVKKLKHNSVHIVGIGLKKTPQAKRSWCYFPEARTPFYRVTYFSNYSPANVPQGGYSSFLCEISFSGVSGKPKEQIIDETIAGLVHNGIIEEKETRCLATKFYMHVPYAYPVPTLERNSALKKIVPYLEQKGVYSRGRFGSWLYEKGNMDHSVMQGVETVDHILKSV
ncbi:MAG TPA: FAD-dependent oxidoreductase [Candidatus Omnitrophota bacterium]|nr:FAD-dependent oxidoreductase [Candidatus Omnitrophota bacterium]